MNSYDILIRTHGSCNDGMGHIYRSLTFCREFQKSGRNAALWIKNDKILNEIVSHGGCPVITVSGDERKDLKDIKPKILISDLPPAFNRTKLSIAALEEGIFHAGIDDMGLAGIEADLCLNPGVVVPEGLSSSYVSGVSYAIIDEKFRKILCRATRKIKKRVKKVLISMGGSDPNKIADSVLRALSELEERNFAIILVSGIAAKTEFNPSGYKGVRIVRSTNNMEELMAESDLAFVSGGITLYESAVVGLPVIVIAQNRFQGRTAKEFDRHGAALYLGICGDISPVRITDACLDLSSDHAGRVSMSRLSRRLIDGRGTIRARMLIEESYEKWREKIVNSSNVIVHRDQGSGKKT